MKGRILFVDVYDSSRGPMAEALARAYGFQAESVGTMPARFVMDAAEAAMAQKGLHVRSHRPHWLDLHHLYGGFDHVIALGHDVEPTSPDLHVMERWDIPDPQHGGLAEHVAVRQALERRIKAMAAQAPLAIPSAS